ncbi:fumarylacetoacetate hydrolase family protein [Paenibacillus sp. SYP-B4298]|uniref:fumarylacetoacetate hydrolase family protein n=1 Tax=Paenibacillus sp. SYP-B4298 TaxID=2996034 RepID=UPI0022DDA238|nr:fumarylacetoacetate hydrolase family protein [Paenibacillus sp. SYP-B4298]
MTLSIQTIQTIWPGLQLGSLYCVGRNYKLHAAELGNEVPDSPMLFMKPPRAAAPMDGQTIALPGRYGAVHYEAELVIAIGREYEAGMKAQELVTGFALGLDLTLRELQDDLKRKQHPWLKAKGFKGSAPMTAFERIDGPDELAKAEFSLQVNGIERQRGHIADMIFDLQTLVDHIGQHYGLGAGDVIFTGTPAGVGAIQDQDEMALFWGDERRGHCRFAIEA